MPRQTANAGHRCCQCPVSAPEYSGLLGIQKRRRVPLGPLGAWVGVVVWDATGSGSRAGVLDLPEGRTEVKNTGLFDQRGSPRASVKKELAKAGRKP